MQGSATDARSDRFVSRLSFHPAAQILTWVLLVAAVQAQAPVTLLYTTALVVLCAWCWARHKFLQLLRRTRWVMLSLLLIYAYSTPGAPMFEALGLFDPSREGLNEGALQLARLLDALAGLALLLAHMQRQQLIAGLYTLFIPLQWLGFSRARLAVRLALTLHYAELEMLRSRGNWQEVMNSLFGAMHQPAVEGHSTLELPLIRFVASDGLLIGCALLLLWLAQT